MLFKIELRIMVFVETYGPDSLYAIVNVYDNDKLIYQGYKQIYHTVDGFPELLYSNTVEVRPVKQTDGQFLVSEDGILFSTKTKRRIKTFINKRGYEVVSTRLNGRKSKPILVRVHRAVAEAFLPFSAKPFVNHIDCNKLNNTSRNLEWVTNQENLIHASENGLLGKPAWEYKSLKLSDDEVSEIKKSTGSSRSVAKRFGINKDTVLRIRNGFNRKKGK